MIGGGPSRVSQPVGRQTIQRPERVSHQPEETQRITEPEPEYTAPQRHRTPVHHAAPKERGATWVKWLVIGLIVAALAACAWVFWSGQQTKLAATIEGDKYQAVFLSNSQVYFGKLSIVDGERMRLTDVYYLERQTTTGDTSESDTTQLPSGNNFQLLKYSDVLYGSEDAMIISNEHIIRFENLRPDGVVAKAIANRK